MIDTCTILNMIIDQIFRMLPWFRWAFIEPLDEAGVYFKSDEQ